MNWRSVFRRTLPAIATFSVMLVAATAVTAQSGTSVLSLTATTMGMTPGSGRPLTIDVSRWSTDAERGTLLAAFAKDEGKTWSQTLQGAPAVGYIWHADGELGYAIRYAQMLPATGGGERFILVTDRALGSWEREPWKATVPGPVDYSFSVIDLQVSRAGQGEGKMSASSKVTVDTAAKRIQLDTHASAPALLKVARPTQARPIPAAGRGASAPAGGGTVAPPVRGAAPRPRPAAK